MVNDPIADMLTRIRNAILAGKEQVSVPSSKMKVRIAEILRDSGYINSFKLVKDSTQGVIKMNLKYHAPRQNAIVGLRRASTPGRRIYMKASDIPRVLRGMGIAIVSTNKGILTDAEARREKCGGELLCYVW
ncbi:MAG: 30S ribosomal protein S8 [Nitrospinae bacterium]|nr:30S ribosomal protein S8 [Nitrospinota bacterium]